MKGWVDRTPPPNIWVRLEILYRRANLQPLDDFLQKPPSSPTRRYRQIGASTWMCARAALDLEDGKRVHLRGRSSSHSDQLRYTTIELAKKLQLPWRTNGNDAHFQNGAYLCASTQKTENGYIEYNDEEWANRAIRRRLGPAHMVTLLRQVSSNIWEAYAEEDEHLFDCTTDGAYVIKANAESVLRVVKMIPLSSVQTRRVFDID